jgi:hypothetical protein
LPGNFEASSKEGSSFFGIPLIASYVLSPKKKQSFVLSAGIKYSWSSVNVLRTRNEFSVNAGIGYKYRKVYSRLFYTASLNEVSKNPDLHTVKFNAVALSLSYNIQLWSGKKKAVIKR